MSIRKCPSARLSRNKPSARQIWNQRPISPSARHRDPASRLQAAWHTAQRLPCPIQGHWPLDCDSGTWDDAPIALVSRSNLFTLFAAPLCRKLPACSGRVEGSLKLHTGSRSFSKPPAKNHYLKIWLSKLGSSAPQDGHSPSQALAVMPSLFLGEKPGSHKSTGETRGRDRAEEERKEGGREGRGGKRSTGRRWTRPGRQPRRRLPWRRWDVLGCSQHSRLVPKGGGNESGQLCGGGRWECPGRRGNTQLGGGG